MNDNSIIALFEQRNEKGIEEAGRAYGGLLRGIAMRILGDSRDAEECINDTLMKAWLAIPPDKPKFLRAYLAKITSNIALNRYESDHAKKRGGGVIPATLDELAECIPAPERTDQVIDRIALTAALDSFLKTIPEKHAKVFMHRYFTMLETDEIAAELHLSQNTVKSILRRTRAKLQTYLEKEGLL